MPDWKAEIRRRLANLRLAPTRETAIIEELSQHLDDCYAELLTSGATPAEAERRTRAELSGNELLARELRRVERQVALEPVVFGTNRRTNMIIDLWQDLRFGARMLLKQPGFTLIAVLTLALGIGANTAILSTINGFILRPLPVEKPEELVAPFWGPKNKAEVWGGLSYANYKDLREQNQSLSGILVWSLASAGISAGVSGDSARAEVAWGELVSANYFDVLGVKPILGRGFLPEEERTQNTHPVVVLGHSLWQQQFNGDAGIVGKTIYMNGTPFTVVGVAPATFKGLKYAFRQAFWVPLMMSAKLGAGREWETTRGWGKWNALARLKPGVTLQQAEADLNRIVEALGQQYPKPNAGKKIQLVAEADGRLEEGTQAFRSKSFLSLYIAGLVLLLACANVANLLLARASGRAKEIGIRLALGAGRWRIVRQLLTESLLLAGLGGALGLVFAYWGTALVQTATPPIPFPIEFDFSPDWYVLKWMASVTLATGLIFGLVPALLASRPDLVTVIKDAAAGQAHGKQRWNLRSALVVTQVGLSIVVLICAGLFLRSLNNVLRLDVGFSTENLVTMKLDPDLLAYDEAAGKRFYAETLRRVTALPGVRAASLANFLPLGDSNDVVGPVTKEGENEPAPNQGINVSSNWVAPGYFATVKTPLVLGRDFTERDTQDAPKVVIVNQAFARKFYGNEHQALGQRIRFYNPQAPLREIIGIAKDGLYLDLQEPPRPYLYLPEEQFYKSSMMLLVSAHTASDLPAITENVRQTIAQLDARMPVTGITLAEANLSFAYWKPRLVAELAGALGALALLLATLGLYSVMTYTVSQRTREIGIHMALGAQLGDVRRLIVGQGMRLVVLGLVLGLAGAFAVTRVLAGQLLGVGTTDPLTFAGMAILLMVVALVACWVPARRAMRVDPLVALRQE
jgi:macrolide transport system ATP-binding/permease protein